MTLINGVRYQELPFRLPGYTSHIAWIDIIDDPLVHAAVLASNINIFRRNAPYAYLFSNGFTEQSWNAEDLGGNITYRRSLEVKQLKRGLWLSAPSHEVATTTVVTAILARDVLPFAHLLGDDEFSLLCLPHQIKLTKIDAVFESSMTAYEAIQSLLASGGYLIKITDLVRMSALSNDEWYTNDKHTSSLSDV